MHNGTIKTRILPATDTEEQRIRVIHPGGTVHTEGYFRTGTSKGGQERHEEVVRTLLNMVRPGVRYWISYVDATDTGYTFRVLEDMHNNLGGKTLEEWLREWDEAEAAR